VSNPEPTLFRWDAERSVMAPLRASRADHIYTDQEIYRLGVIEERSTNSHNHYFAALAEAWLNLPEQLSARYPTVEHFRKTGLIEAGFCDTHTLVCSSKAEAQRVAAFARPIDEYSIVTARECTVTRYVAKSQSVRAMGKGDFQASKQAVLEWAAAQIGTSSAALAKNAGRAA
jgi:hypothetical protein